VVSFFTADVNYTIRSKNHIRKWLQSLIGKEGKSAGQLSIILCSDEYLWNLNKDFLNHRTYTDIITFDQSTFKGEVAGELYISLERIRDNAKKFNATVKDELHRVIVHGVLHLCGYGDKTSRLKTKMTAKENEYLTNAVFRLFRAFPQARIHVKKNRPRSLSRRLFRFSESKWPEIRP
jgi:probable rRNA maturation factor